MKNILTYYKEPEDQTIEKIPVAEEEVNEVAEEEVNSLPKIVIVILDRILFMYM